MFQAHAQSRLEVQASNDPEFNDHVVLCERADLPWYRKPDSHASNMWEQFIPEMKPFRFLRVQSTSPEGILNFAEFEAYGVKAEAKPKS